MKIRTLPIITQFFCLLAFALPANAAFNCSVNVTGLNFGSYDVFSTTPKDTTATITVTCKAPPPAPNPPFVTISLNPGTSGSFAPRRLQRAGGDPLEYNLFTTPSFSTVWGDGSGGTQTQTSLNPITNVTPWITTLYGRIPARQNVSAGSYSDTIIVTIDW